MLRSRLLFSDNLYVNQWIEFRDNNGKGYAQPDCYLLLRDKVILFECKLTETLRGHDQLSALYAPLLTWIYKRPVIKVLVCRGLSSSIRFRKEIDSLEQAIASDSPSVLTWLWLP